MKKVEHPKYWEFMRSLHYKNPKVEPTQYAPVIFNGYYINSYFQ